MSLVKGPLFEVILFVQDMARAVRFYHQLLGLKLRYPQDVTDFSNQMWVEIETGDCTLALHGGAEIKPDPLHEIVFTVNDVDQARATLLASGISIGETRVLEDGHPTAEGVDPEGHRFAIRS
jgi:predicted enzyme related to lactoylglutathione lyase